MRQILFYCIKLLFFEELFFLSCCRIVITIRDFLMSKCHLFILEIILMKERQTTKNNQNGF